MVGSGLDCITICFGSVDAHSGPSGENPTGTAGYNTGNHGLYVQNARVTCLAVSGNEAAIGFYGPNSPTYYYPPGNYSMMMVVQDRVASTEETGDAFSAGGGSGPPPTQADCEAALPIGRDLYAPGPNDYPLYAAFTVHDAKPLPTTKDQCKNGGWRSFGVFKNEGDCVSFVATGGRNQPGRQ